jgi:colanic acid/amylovoran biosynthesis glycosyltransferase
MSLLAGMAKWRRAYQLLFEHGDMFLVEGSNMARCLAAMGCPEERILLFRVGISLAAIDRCRHPLVEHDGRPRVLMAGRMVEKKGMTYGLAAFAQVARKHPEAALRVAGDGPLRESLQAQAAELGIAQRVEWLGPLSYADYVRELLQASILLAPSVVAADGDSEGGAPTVLLEAQAARVPVLSTTHADIPEVVLDGESGYLAPERDVGALAERLDWLLSHPDAWESLGAAGRAHVEADHDVAVQARTLEAIYAELLRSAS